MTTATHTLVLRPLFVEMLDKHEANSKIFAEMQEEYEEANPEGPGWPLTPAGVDALAQQDLSVRTLAENFIEGFEGYFDTLGKGIIDHGKADNAFQMKPIGVQLATLKEEGLITQEIAQQALGRLGQLLYMGKGKEGCKNPMPSFIENIHMRQTHLVDLTIPDLRQFFHDRTESILVNLRVAEDALAGKIEGRIASASNARVVELRTLKADLQSSIQGIAACMDSVVHRSLAPDLAEIGAALAEVLQRLPDGEWDADDRKFIVSCVREELDRRDEEKGVSTHVRELAQLEREKQRTLVLEIELARLRETFRSPLVAK